MTDQGRRKDVRIKAKLKVRFKDVNAFMSEYTHNISKGGLFVRTKKPCEKGSMVEVVLVIPDTDKEISAVGEVIHVVSSEQATKKFPAGMGVSLKELSDQDQEFLDNFIKEALEKDSYADGLGRRKHERFEARIKVRFGSLDALVEEYSHNISHGGIFIRTQKPKKLHEKVKVILAHPLTNDEIILDGEVVRSVSVEDSKRTGHPAGMGVHFLSDDKYTRSQLEAFINATCNNSSAELELSDT